MEFVEKIKQKAKSNLKTIVLPEAEEERNLKAADRILSEGFAKLILIGNPEKVHHLASEPVSYTHLTLPTNSRV